MKLIYRTASLALVAITLQSCIATKKYERPEITIEENFRTENIATDSLSMASLPWNEVFTDSKLQEYIAYGLDNNMDIRTAIQNIEAAEAYATQGKMGYYPTLNIGANYTHSVNSLNTQNLLKMNHFQYFLWQKKPPKEYSDFLLSFHKRSL